MNRTLMVVTILLARHVLDGIWNGRGDRRNESLGD